MVTSTSGKSGKRKIKKKGRNASFFYACLFGIIYGMKGNTPDWVALKNEYVIGAESYRKLSDKYSIPLSTIRDHGRGEGWYAARVEFRHKVTTESTQRALDSAADNLAQLADMHGKIAYILSERVLHYVQTQEVIEPIDMLRLSNTLASLRSNTFMTDSEDTGGVVLLPQVGDISE